MVDLKYLLTKLYTQKKRLNASRRIVLGFATVILTGTFLLMLPISSNSGEMTSFITALFTATSTTCVTGLALVDTATHWNAFGQLVMLCLIQIGGLGFIAVLSITFFLSRRHIGLRDRMMMAQSLNVDSMSGIVRMMKKIIIIAFSIEAIGAAILSARFIPMFGIGKGIWYGVFHAISAFCNAGFDLLGVIMPMGSLEPVNSDPVILITICCLIVIGGLGFFVWDDILGKRSWKKFSLYTKMVLIITAILIVSGWIIFYLLEKANSQTLGAMSTFDKTVNALFQSVTTRTAGFASFNQANMSEQSKMISTVLMMIDGSSGSTAGGIKTVTVGLVLISAYNIMKSNKKVVIGGRHIGHSQIMYAAALTILALILLFAGGFVVSIQENATIVDAMYETASAYGTVGLTTGLTSLDNSLVTHWIFILYMFFGRVGIMTITVSTLTKGSTAKDDMLNYPGEKLLLG